MDGDTLNKVQANRLLERVPDLHRNLLSPIQRVRLTAGDELERAGSAISHVYFPECGVVSMMSPHATKSVEVGVIGFEGMTGTGLVLGEDRSDLSLIVETPGWAMRATREVFLATLEIVELRAIWLSHANSVLVQLGDTARTYAIGQLRKRVARWLLMRWDRSPDEELTVTHGYIAALLGVRRASVTMALHLLEGAHLIKSNRRRMALLDREGLEQFAGDLYEPLHGPHALRTS